MKKINKLLAILLSMVVFLSGNYFVKTEGYEAQAEEEIAEATETTEATEATVVPDMLDVKVQPGTNSAGEKALRFVTSVNSLNYKEVGFVIEYQKVDEEGNPVTDESGNPVIETITEPIDTVFERIKSVVTDKDNESYIGYQFSPKVVDTSSEYFATVKMKVTNHPERLYTVKAYVIPLGGTDADKEYGTSRCVAFEDCSASTYVNMSFVSSIDPKTQLMDAQTQQYKTLNVSYIPKGET